MVQCRTQYTLMKPYSPSIGVLQGVYTYFSHNHHRNGKSNEKLLYVDFEQYVVNVVARWHISLGR